VLCCVDGRAIGWDVVERIVKRNIELVGYRGTTGRTRERREKWRGGGMIRWQGTPMGREREAKGEGEKGTREGYC
jgi:hypothetical protein